MVDHDRELEDGLCESLQQPPPPLLSHSSLVSSSSPSSSQQQRPQQLEYHRCHHHHPQQQQLSSDLRTQQQQEISQSSAGPDGHHLLSERQQQHQQHHHHHHHHRQHHQSSPPPPPSPQQQQKPTKRLTQEERDYWQHRLPLGFQFYLERLARGVIRNQPANILEFATVYLEELLVNRNTELWKLPEEPYFNKLFKRKLGFCPWQTKSRRPTARKEKFSPVGSQDFPDLVAVELLPETSHSSAESSNILAAALRQEQNSSGIVEEIEEAYPVDSPQGLYGSYDMLTARDCESNQSQSARKDGLITSEGVNPCTTSHSGISGTPIGLSSSSSSNFYTATDTPTSTNMGGRDKLPGEPVTLDKHKIENKSAFEDTEILYPVSRKPDTFNCPMDQKNTASDYFRIDLYEKPLSDDETGSKTLNGPRLNQENEQKKGPNQSQQLDGLKSDYLVTDPQTDNLARTERELNTMINSYLAPGTLDNAGKIFTEPLAEDESLYGRLPCEATDKLANKKRTTMRTCSLLSTDLNPCHSDKLLHNGVLKRFFSAEAQQCKPSSSEYDALVQRATQNGVYDLYINTYDHVKDSMHQTKYFQSGLDKNGILITGRSEETAESAGSMKRHQASHQMKASNTHLCSTEDREQPAGPTTSGQDTSGTILETEYPREIENKHLHYIEHDNISAVKPLYHSQTTNLGNIHNEAEDVRAVQLSCPPEETVMEEVAKIHQIFASSQDKLKPKAASPELAISGNSDKTKPESVEKSNVSTAERIAVEVVEKVTHKLPEFTCASSKTGTDVTASAQSRSRTHDGSWEEDDNDTIAPISDIGNDERSFRGDPALNLTKRNATNELLRRRDIGVHSATGSHDSEKLTSSELADSSNVFMIESAEPSASDQSQLHTFVQAMQDSRGSGWSFPTALGGSYRPEQETQPNLEIGLLEIQGEQRCNHKNELSVGNKQNEYINTGGSSVYLEGKDQKQSKEAGIIIAPVTAKPTDELDVSTPLKSSETKAEQRGKAQKNRVWVESFTQDGCEDGNVQLTDHQGEEDIEVCHCHLQGKAKNRAQRAIALANKYISELEKVASTLDKILNKDHMNNTEDVKFEPGTLMGSGEDVGAGERSTCSGNGGHDKYKQDIIKEENLTVSKSLLEDIAYQVVDMAEGRDNLSSYPGSQKSRLDYSFGNVTIKLQAVAGSNANACTSEGNKDNKNGRSEEYGTNMDTFTRDVQDKKESEFKSAKTEPPSDRSVTEITCDNSNFSNNVHNPRTTDRCIEKHRLLDGHGRRSSHNVPSICALQNSSVFSKKIKGYTKTSYSPPILMQIGESDRNANNNGNSPKAQEKYFPISSSNIGCWAPKMKQKSFFAQLKERSIAHWLRPRQSDLVLVDGRKVFNVPMEAIGQQCPEPRVVRHNKVTKPQNGILICEQENNSSKTSRRLDRNTSCAHYIVSPIYAKKVKEVKPKHDPRFPQRNNGQANTNKSPVKPSPQFKYSPKIIGNNKYSLGPYAQHRAKTQMRRSSSQRTSSVPPRTRSISPARPSSRSSTTKDRCINEIRNQLLRRKETPHSYSVTNVSNPQQIKGDNYIQSMLYKDRHPSVTSVSIDSANPVFNEEETKAEAVTPDKEQKCSSPMCKLQEKRAKANANKKDHPASIDIPKNRTSPLGAIKKQKKLVEVEGDNKQKAEPCKSVANVPCESKSKSNQLQSRKAEAQNLTKASDAVMLHLVEKPEMETSLSSVISRALFGDPIDLPVTKLEKTRARNAKRTPLVQKLEEAAGHVGPVGPQFKRSEFPMRVHPFPIPNDESDYIPELTRRLTIESPIENLLIHTSYVRPNPCQPEVRGLYELTSQKRRLYLGEKEDFINTDGTRRLVCETECFSSKDPDTQSLVVENGTLRITHASVDSGGGDAFIEETQFSSPLMTGEVNEGAQVAEIVTNVTTHKTSRWYKNNYVRMVGDYVMIGGGKNLKALKDIVHNQGRRNQSSQKGNRDGSSKNAITLPQRDDTDMFIKSPANFIQRPRAEINYNSTSNPRSSSNSHKHSDTGRKAKINNNSRSNKALLINGNTNNNSNNSSQNWGDVFEFKTSHLGEGSVQFSQDVFSDADVLDTPDSHTPCPDISYVTLDCLLASPLASYNINNNSSFAVEKVSEDHDDTTLEDIAQIPMENPRHRSKIGAGICMSPKGFCHAEHSEIGDFAVQVDPRDINRSGEVQTGLSISIRSPTIPKRLRRDIESKMDKKFCPLTGCETPQDAHTPKGHPCHFSAQTAVTNICYTDEVQTGYPKDMTGHVFKDIDLKTHCRCPSPAHEKRRKFDTEVQASVCDISPSVRAQTGSSLCLNEPYEPGKRKPGNRDEVTGHIKRFESCTCNYSATGGVGDSRVKLEGQTQVEATDINPSMKIQTGESMLLTSPFPPPKPEVTDDFSEGPEVTWGDLSIYEMGPEHRSMSSYATQFDLMLTRDQEGRILYPKHYKATLKHEEQKKVPTGCTHTCFPPSGRYEVSPCDRPKPIKPEPVPVLADIPTVGNVNQPVADYSKRMVMAASPKPDYTPRQPYEASQKSRDHESAGEIRVIPVRRESLTITSYDKVVDYDSDAERGHWLTTNTSHTRRYSGGKRYDEEGDEAERRGESGTHSAYKRTRRPNDGPSISTQTAGHSQQRVFY